MKGGENMDFKKVRALVDQSIALDIEGADEHELRVNYKPGDDNCWFSVTPEKYQDEAELAAVINTETDRKLHGKIKTSI